MTKKQASSAPQAPQFRCQVALPVALDKTFSYTSHRALPAGSLVDVPLRNGKLMGVVWPESLCAELSQPAHQSYSLKPIDSVYDLPPFSVNFMTFIDWVARYTLAPLGNVLKLGLSVRFTPKQLAAPLPAPCSPNIQQLRLTAPQQEAWASLRHALQNSPQKPILLQGVTGAGKTEVYFKGLEETLAQEGTCLILQPEINLTHDWIKRFEKHFGFTPCLWHSHLTPKQRQINWRQILQGQAKVVVGARSALFLPYPKLNFILVDEEHDGSYKQEEQTLYNARDMAVVRAKIENCPILLVSATPSLETQLNVQTQKYSAVYLTQRYGAGGLPTVSLVDMRTSGAELRKLAATHKRPFYISPTSQEAIQETLDKGQQALLFLNRRGYAPLTLCRACGHRLQCPNCTAWLVDHRNQAEPVLSCHHCGHTKPAPTACPICAAEDALYPCGPGVERIAEELAFLFPQARVQLMTSETLHTPKEAALALEKIQRGQVDIIVGTQIMAKGHTFPNLTLTVVVDADLGLGTADLRAGEKTFQLLHQVGGRAGRSTQPGTVLLQTFDPSHPVMEALQSYNDQAFYDLEQQKRQGANLPPYAHMATVTISSSKEAEARTLCLTLGQSIPKHDPSLKILGPAPAAMAKRKRQFRWRFLLQAPKEVRLQNFISRWVAPIKTSNTAKISIDIDPLSFV